MSPATHDTSRSKYHINELGTFAARLENVSFLLTTCAATFLCILIMKIKAAASIFPNIGRPRYKSVRALLLRWEEDSLGVQHELDDLAHTFQSVYGFYTETWLIPTVKPYFALTEKALQVVRDFGHAGSLLIVYYAGHGLINDSRKAVWAW